MSKEDYAVAVALLILDGNHVLYDGKCPCSVGIYGVHSDEMSGAFFVSAQHDSRLYVFSVCVKHLPTYQQGGWLERKYE